MPSRTLQNQLANCAIIAYKTVFHSYYSAGQVFFHLFFFCYQEKMFVWVLQLFLGQKKKSAVRHDNGTKWKHQYATSENYNDSVMMTI